MTGEFDLIDAIVATLGAATEGPGVVLGPGDDAALLRLDDGDQLVSSVDTLVEAVHFPTGAPPERIARRALGVAVSDLAAMGARPLGVLIAAVLPAATDARWVRAFARGLAEPARAWGAPVVGGNLARGPLSISVTVLGALPEGAALTRGWARPGDQIWVSGPLGGAAAALARGAVFERDRYAEPGCERYFEPQPRLELGVRLRGIATAAIDVSDGLAADLTHLARASGVTLALDASSVPLYPGSTLEQALHGGDDYELAFTAPPGIDVRIAAGPRMPLSPQQGAARSLDVSSDRSADRSVDGSANRSADMRADRGTETRTGQGSTQGAGVATEPQAAAGDDRSPQLVCIGRALARGSEGADLLLDGAPLAARGFDHFG
ncbi:MAG: thiamine-phosphate kinase [Pseudomonadota bacterium]